MGSFKDIQIDELNENSNSKLGDSEPEKQTAPLQSVTNEIVSLPLDAINTDFKNTRRKVSQADVEGLKCSIQQIGLISAITVTPLADGQYQLVSGFNRLEALRQLNYKTVNAIVMHEADPANVLEANIAENVVRKGLSLGEQSTAIKRLFTVLEGDEANKIDQISVRLNLSTKAVKDRLVLTALSEEGLAAFDDGKIALKTAIVLAGMTEQDQEKFLNKFQKGVLTHDGLLEEIGKATIPLSVAKFDLTDCQQCPSNSELQGSLFTDVNSSCEANCHNASCFKGKSKAWFDARVVELEQEYGTIIPVSQVERTEINPINSDSLGETQISQCATCTNNVNLIQNKVGSSFGDVIHNICNNKTCFTECATVHQEQQRSVDAKSTLTEQKAPTEPLTDIPKNGDIESRPSKVAATATMSKAAREQARKDLATVQLNMGLSDNRDSTMLLFLAMQRLTGQNRQGDIKTMQQAVDLDRESLQANINKMLLDYLNKSLKETGDTNADRPIGNVLIGLLRGKNQVDEAIIQSWTPAHLKHATKAGIKAILIEAGFDKAYDEKLSKGAFNKLMGGKLDAIHLAIEASDFDFTYFSPKSYNEYARKVAASIE